MEFNLLSKIKTAIHQFVQAALPHARTGIASIATGQGRRKLKVE
jgi:hypothetical protein